MGKRSFDQAIVVACGAQSLQDRFPKRQRRHDIDDFPPIVHWRCNLTGLSQVYNLYFIAYSDKIYVYVPQFSTQAIPEKPALIVTSQASSPGLQGYLDPNRPHAINNLVVQFLGIDEVIAVVRDDGDVDAFLVRHIWHAINRRSESSSSIDVEADDVRPFFQSNVGMSAWGLAIHSHARIIATSANTHNITIFKFGLVETEENDEMQYLEGAHPAGSGDRGMDVTHQVLNGTSNIPYIAFCNTGDDLEARWLLTTDISGLCRSIDLHSMQISSTFRFGVPLSYLGDTSYDRFNSGWAIMFLDRRSFIPERTVQAALGLAEDEVLPVVQDSNAMWDIGATVNHVADTARKFSLPKKRPSTIINVHSAETSPDTSAERSRSASISVAEDSSTGEDDPLIDTDQYTEADVPTAPREDDSSDSGDSTFYIDLEPDDEGTEDIVSFNATYRGRRLNGNGPRGYPPNNNICGDNPCPILHASVRSVYLLQPSNQRETHSRFTSPTVGFTNALHQLVQGEFSYLNGFERLNMNAYIPAIGIVVLASQKGRALIISLTKLSKSTRYPAKMQDPACPGPRAKYAMRIEHIVPFAHQEEKSQRPFAPLMGIATGPMQGTEHLPQEKKRWRLMMLYADHSILSYEISRRRFRDSAIDIQGVAI